MRDVVPTDFRYRGDPATGPRVSIAPGNSGDLQVEIIEQRDAQPSAYREFLDSGREGLQHVSSWLTPAQYDSTRARLLDTGSEIVHEGRVALSNVRFAYFATERSSTPLFEIADVRQPGVYEGMEAIASAARDWDGSDPVRVLG